MTGAAGANRRRGGCQATGMVWALGVSIALRVSAQPLPEAAAAPAMASAMRSAATQLLAATPTPDRGRLAFPFDDSLRADWHYTPRRRAGLAFKDMTDAQRAAARALLQAPLSARGLAQVDDVMALEEVLRELEAGSSLRVPHNYAVAVYGTPEPDKAWGWRVEGHHLSLHVTLDRDGVVSTLPQFIGANPARVPAGMPSGPKALGRALGTEEDAARALLISLSASQRSQAVISNQTYGDIVSRNAPQAKPIDKAGIGFTALNAEQGEALLSLARQFAAGLKPALADARMQRVRSGGVESLQFAWVGSLEKGQGHYFRIQGANFLIEYDNSGGNHVHSVWRDFDGDWGRDVLADHYRRGRQSPASTR